MALLKKWWWIGAIVAAAGIAAVLLFVVYPGGAKSPEQAVLGHVSSEADGGTAHVLVEQPWGDGELVLARYQVKGEHRLSLAFVIERGRGWHVASFTEQHAEPDDVAVGSLLVAHSPGGSGQPAWSAAVGELSDGRIQTIEITWGDAKKDTGSRHNDAYVVVRAGTAGPTTARYIAEDGSEIASVPVQSQ